MKNHWKTAFGEINQTELSKCGSTDNIAINQFYSSIRIMSLNGVMQQANKYFTLCSSIIAQPELCDSLIL